MERAHHVARRIEAGAGRRLIYLVLGVALIIDAAVERSNPAQLIAGLVLLGLIPAEQIAGRARNSCHETGRTSTNIDQEKGQSGLEPPQ